MSKALWVLALVALLSSGCGATTLRLSAGPELDSNGDGGFDVMATIGTGIPLDFEGRSHHYVQAYASMGGGGTGEPLSGQFTALGGIDYMYWAEPRLAMRTGAFFAYRSVWDTPAVSSLAGGGGHLALLPIVKTWSGGPIATIVCLGPDIRVLAFAGGPTFAVPLVFELDVLAAGD